MRYLLILAALGAAFAADAPKPVNPITPEIRAAWWRAVAEQAAAKIRFDATTGAVEAKRAEMVKACGERPLVADPQGEPVCGEKPTKENAK